MKKNLLSVLALAALLGLLVACSNGAVPVGAQNEDVSTTQRAEAQGIHGFLTRVEYGDNIAYLFGDYWLARSNKPSFAPIVEEAMQRTDVFFVRGDGTASDDPVFQEFLHGRILLPGDVTMANYLPPDIYEKFVYYIESHNVDTWFLDVFVPTMIVGTGIPLEMAGKLNAEMFSVGNFIEDYATAAGLPTYAFLDPFWISYVLNPVSDEIQFAAAQTVTHMEDTLLRLEAILSAYEQQNETLLIEMLRSPIYDGMNAYKRHLAEVDLLFAEEFRLGIAELLRETEEPTTFFIPTRIENIIGDDDANIIRLLERDGFVITRLYE